MLGISLDVWTQAIYGAGQAPFPGDNLLLESGDNFLLETGDTLLFE